MALHRQVLSSETELLSIVFICGRDCDFPGNLIDAAQSLPSIRVFGSGTFLFLSSKNISFLEFSFGFI